jgi:hypothetical protein
MTDRAENAVTLELIPVPAIQKRILDGQRRSTSRVLFG